MSDIERWIVRKRDLVRAVPDWDPERINDPVERLQWTEVVPLTTHQGAVGRAERAERLVENQAQTIRDLSAELSATRDALNVAEGQSGRADG